MRRVPRPPLSELRVRLSRQLRNLPPGRRLRLRLAVDVVEELVGDRDDVRLLDAGSEEGLLCLELARRHPRWTLVGVDISHRPLVRGSAWSREEHLGVSYVQADLQRPLGEELYDVVASLESLVEVPDDREAMRSIVAALKVGGLVVAQVPTHDWTPVLSGAERTWRREARHGYDRADLVSMFEGLGLDVLEVRPTFRRTTALAQDVRDRLKHRGRVVRLGLLPLSAAAVGLERHGLAWGPPRALFVVAVKRPSGR
ncbi:2-polyprenyl-3-methyl-5-hydroxy-6-metoxy-1,4-benzoquinol methylase [Nocardioides aurantiacus]|uniref:2-polyprenyl-3-methyl-5-hydroxy-6-metoxy-1, 4-benzoquinol methylase n=1 Tax=Nocardioides aurantiacus TaxID=86796 RepID=A0A3N2CRI5_9ACTN|nr:2-polyprenyl-3-methyl-5-hydroxy-6-metoxy-1,4-benzoquinol methylase [Nocardioides aurantiacus]